MSQTFGLLSSVVGLAGTAFGAIELQRKIEVVAADAGNARAASIEGAYESLTGGRP